MRTLVNIVVDKKRQEKQTNKMGHETKSNNHVPSGTPTPFRYMIIVTESLLVLYTFSRCSSLIKEKRSRDENQSESNIEKDHWCYSTDIVEQCST